MRLTMIVSASVWAILAFTSIVQAAEIKIGALVDGQITALMVKEGETVQKGQILLEIDPRPLHTKVSQLKSKIKLAEAQLKDAKIDFEAEKALFDQTVTAKRRFDNALLTNEIAQSKLDVLKAELAEVQVQMDYHIIRAPVTAKVSKLMILKGDTVFHENQPLVYLEVQ